jgi:predicted nucleic acid-binding protein
MPVVDASVIVEFVTFGEGRESAERRLRENDHVLWAPHLLDAEVGQALRRAVRQESLDADTAAEALWHLDELPLRRVSHEALVHYAWEMRENVSFYDGLYVALAEILDEPLLTFDARLERAGVSTKVEVIAS